MKITTAISCETEHGPIGVSLRDDDTVVVIKQGDDAIWIPRTDIAEFCRILTEWEAGQ